jgi:hypothetical protein
MHNLVFQTRISSIFHFGYQSVSCRLSAEMMGAIPLTSTYGDSYGRYRGISFQLQPLPLLLSIKQRRKVRISMHFSFLDRQQEEISSSLLRNQKKYLLFSDHHTLTVTSKDITVFKLNIGS